MCTLILLRRPGHDWPLLLAANRDEMISRPWLPPARHWPEYPNVVAGADRLADGSWLGLNDQGVLTIVMNRSGSLGPQAGRRSRGELVLKALTYGEATAAAAALSELEPGLYRSFNLVVADCRQAIWLCHRDDGKHHRIDAQSLGNGVSMLTNRDCNDRRSIRIRTYLPRFRSAPPPDPGSADGWSSWTDLLAEETTEPTDKPHKPLTLANQQGFATLSSSLIALPAAHRMDLQPVWLFATCHPERTDYQPVALSPRP